VLKGLYVILDPHAANGRPLVDILTAAADGGAKLFQYRDKTASMLDAYRQALQLRQAAAKAGALFIVNDRCDLALAVDADGVHLGQIDLPIDKARMILGQGKLIGLSTHNLDQVKAAADSGADYLGFGPIFATGTKPDHDPVVGIDGLRQAKRLTTLPMFAIGGITLETAAHIRAAGADGLAVISSIAQATDVAKTAAAFVACFRQ